MKCYINDTTKIIEVSKELEKKILSIIEKFEVYYSGSYGLQANNDGGIDDVSYSYKHYPLVFENFIVDGKKVIGYVFEEKIAAFDGENPVVIYDIDNTDRSGWNDLVDTERAKIILKK